MTTHEKSGTNGKVTEDSELDISLIPLPQNAKKLVEKLLPNFQIKFVVKTRPHYLDDNTHQEFKKDGVKVIEVSISRKMIHVGYPAQTFGLYKNDSHPYDRKQDFGTAILELIAKKATEWIVDYDKVLRDMARIKPSQMLRGKNKRIN